MNATSQLRGTATLLACVGLLLIVAAGCHSFPPPTPALLDRVTALEEPSKRLRVEGSAELDSEALRGEFQALLAAVTGKAPRVRMQLLPDIGPKVLDVTATTAGFVGRIPANEHALQISTDEVAPRDFLTLVALTLLESHSAIDPRRVTGARRIDPHGMPLRTSPDEAAGGNWQIEYEGSWPGLSVVAELNSQGRVTKRSYCFRSVRWSESREVTAEGVPRTVIRGKGFDLTVTATFVEEDPDLPDSLFDLPDLSAKDVKP